MKTVHIVLFSISLEDFAICDSEFYCNIEEGNYEICRRCPTLDENCEIPSKNQGCQCDNIKFTNASKYIPIRLYKAFFLKFNLDVFKRPLIKF